MISYRTEEDSDISSDDDRSVNETFEPCVRENAQVLKDQTTMFLNKYIEDTNMPSVANRLSDIIIDYEVAKPLLKLITRFIS